MTRPPFNTLPESTLAGLRWVGSTLMDEEQFTVEGWHVERETADGFKWWACTLEGLNRYSTLRAQRRADRKATWAARNAEDEGFRAYVDALDDAKAGH